MPPLSFANPWALILLAGLPFFVWARLRRRRAAVVFPDLRILAGVPRGRARFVRSAVVALEAAAVALLVAAAAGPRWPETGSRIPARGIAIAIALDVSQSMKEVDFVWGQQLLTRLDAARNVFRLFVEGGEGPEGRVFEGRGQDLISLTVFARRPETVCPLTLSHDALAQILDRQQVESFGEESRTNIGDAIVWALKGLRTVREGRKVIVLLTDGEHNVDAPAYRPRQAAQLAGNLEVPIYVIDAGSDIADPEAGGEAKLSRRRARESLEEVAAISGGKYFAADNTAALLGVCAAIDDLERVENLSWQYLRYREGYPWFALAAFAALAFTLTLQSTLWRRIP